MPSVFSYLWLLGGAGGWGIRLWAALLESFAVALGGAAEALGLSPKQAKGSTAVQTVRLVQGLGRGSLSPALKIAI